MLGKKSGQLVRKSTVGRPFGGDAEFARHLPEVVGRTEEARRKAIERARKIAKIYPEAKKIIRRGALADNQALLLKIAKKSGWKAQKKCAEVMLALVAAQSSTKHSLANKSKDDGAVSSGDEHLAFGEPDAEPALKGKTTTYEALEKFWRKKGAKLWAYTPIATRNRFYEMLKKCRCNSPVDAKALVDSVFCGRGRVYCRELYGYATSHGVAKPAIRKVLKKRKYKLKKPSGQLHYYVNKDPDWKDRLLAVSAEALEQTKEADPVIYERPECRTGN
jgi:hypothetical protein